MNPNSHRVLKNRVQDSYAKMCIRHEVAELLNITPHIIKEQVYTHSLPGFSQYIKQYFIGLNEVFCQVNNRYICNPPV